MEGEFGGIMEGGGGGRGAKEGWWGERGKEGWWEERGKEGQQN